MKNFNQARTEAATLTLSTSLLHLVRRATVAAEFKVFNTLREANVDERKGATDWLAAQAKR